MLARLKDLKTNLMTYGSPFVSHISKFLLYFHSKNEQAWCLSLNFVQGNKVVFDKNNGSITKLSVPGFAMHLSQEHSLHSTQDPTLS